MGNSGLPQNAWVLIADGEKALILENIGDGQDMHLTVRREKDQSDIEKAASPAGPSGRMPDTGRAQRSALDESDWQTINKERFASELSDMLYKAAHQGKFDHLAILASRVVLSTLRDELHKEVTDKVILEVPKVLTNHPIDEIEDLVARAMQDAA